MSDDLPAGTSSLELVVLRRCTANRHNQHNAKKRHCPRAEFNKLAGSDFVHHPPPSKSVSREITDLWIFYSFSTIDRAARKLILSNGIPARGPWFSLSDR